MKEPNLCRGKENNIYKDGVVRMMIASLALFMLSCTETNLDAGEMAPKSIESSSSYKITPHDILSSRGVENINGDKAKKMVGSAELSSPLFGLATAPNGNILVADAGSGIVRLHGGKNISLPGVTDMSPVGSGSMWTLEGLSGDPGEDTGQAFYRVSNGKISLIVDLFDFEAANNPDGGLIDSNPFDVQALGGKGALVADPGANDLLYISNQGNVDVLAIFPNELVSTGNLKNLFGCPDGPPDFCGLPDMIPAQAVPTSVAVGPDGYYYVGELKGFPAPAGASNIWRVSPNASGAICGSSPDCVKVFDGGFTSVIDLAFDANGMLHVVELDEQSWFAVEFLDPATVVGGTINVCDLGSLTCSEIATGIPILTAITFGKDESLWATRNALIPGLAEVFKVQ